MAFQLGSRRVLDTGATVGPQIYLILRERIICNDIPPGARVREPEISLEFAVSRQPVREALIRLSVEGLVEVRPQRGTFVRKIAMSEVLDARFVREAIEADVVKELAASRVPGLVDELRNQVVDQERAAVQDPMRFMELDEHFHRTLAKAAGKTYARNLIEGVKLQMDRVRHLTLHQFPMGELVNQHKSIVNAIEAGDVSAAESAMRTHLREILKTLPAVAASKPEFFEPVEK